MGYSLHCLGFAEIFFEITVHISLSTYDNHFKNLNKEQWHLM